MTMRGWVLCAATFALAGPALAGQGVEQGTTGKGGKGSNSPVPFMSKPNAPKSPSSPNTAPAPANWYNDGMEAIREKNPGRAVTLMKPVLADFEKRYADEKRHIYCAINPAQTAAYTDDAKKAAQDFVTIEPGWCRAQYVRAYALIDLDDLDGALVAFRRLTDLAPRNSRYLSELGYVLSTKRKYAEALAVYERSLAAIGISPDDADTERCAAYRGMGFNLGKLGRIVEAEKAYRACLKIEPDNEEVQDAIDELKEATKDTV